MFVAALTTRKSVSALDIAMKSSSGFRGMTLMFFYNGRK